MKPLRFDYLALRSPDETPAFPAARGMDAEILASGQRLVPLLDSRVVRPAYLVDPNEMTGLVTVALATTCARATAARR